MTSRARVVVVGGSGFVGSAVVRALLDRGAEAQVSPAPRIRRGRAADVEQLVSQERLLREWADRFRGASAVVNAAGLAAPTGIDEKELNAANAAVPAVLARACGQAGVARFIHISSAAVQGRRPELDECPRTEPLTAYARSKALGERLVLRERGPSLQAVVYRPASVHGADRPMTLATARLARSVLATVVDPVQSTPAALVDNVGDAAAFLALSSLAPPPVVAHPWEGLTTADLLAVFGGREPRRVPAWAARPLVAALVGVGRLSPWAAAHARRVELMWFGQRVAPSWLTEAGWRAPLGSGAWTALAAGVAPGVAGLAFSAAHQEPH